MRFPLIQLYGFNESKPIVEVEGIDGELQWDTCSLRGLPPKRLKGSMTDHGAVPKGQYDNLPTKFMDINGDEYKIENIHTLGSSK